MIMITIEMILPKKAIIIRLGYKNNFTNTSNAFKEMD